MISLMIPLTAQATPDCHLYLRPESEAGLCDCALAHSAGRALLHSLPQLAGRLTDTTVVLVTNIGAFVSKGNMFNVIKSGHGSWMFASEAVNYMQSAWPTVFTAMTVQRWRQITKHSNSCSELVQNSPELRQYYQPPWSKNINGSQKLADRTNIDIMMAVSAMEKLITRSLLMLRICHLPAFNRVWTDLNASQAFDYSTQDFDTCWKGSCFVGKVLAKPRLQLKLTVVSGIPTPTTAPQKYACTLPFTLQCLSRYIQAFVWATKAYVPELRPYH